MKAISRLAACCVLLTATINWADDEAPRVGDLGDPSRLVIEGAKSFTADEIREALGGDLAVVAASAADAPLADLQTIIAKKLAAGYQCAGFPQAAVDVKVVDGKLRALVGEGDRYLAGDVQITGCQKIDAGRIRQALTQPDAELHKAAIWTGGEPASFNTEYVDWLKSKVIDLAGDQGFYRAKVNVHVVPDHDGLKTGRLVIAFGDEGPRTTFGDFSFTSTRQYEELFPFLDIERQTPLTSELRQQIVQRLLASGRFARASWDLGEANRRRDDWMPGLELEDYEAAPLLSETPTREEAALLKLAQWVSRFDESDDELLIRFPAERVSAVIAPRRGYIVELAPQANTAHNDAPPFLNAAVMAESRVGLYSSSQRRKIDAAPPPAPIVGQAEVLLIGGQPTWDGHGGLTAGVGLRGTTTNVLRRHVKLNLKLSAAAAMSVVRTHQAKASWDGDVVSFEWKGRRLKVNSLTGRLIEFVVEASSNKENSGNSLPAITLVHGEFERRLTEIEKISTDWPNLADGQRPLSCIGQFVCQELAVFDSKGRQGYAAVEKLLGNGLLEPIDGLVRQSCLPDSQGFRVPQPYSHYQFHSLAELVSQSGALARIYGMQLGNYLLPSEGWIGSLWRNGVFLLVDKRQEVADELARQPADGGGVLCAWLAAEMLRAGGFGDLSPLCARRGLRHLSVSSLHDDCRELLSGQRFLSTALLRMAQAFRGLDAGEVRAIGNLMTRAEILDEKQAFFFETFATTLSRNAEQPTVDTLVSALDVFWHARFSDWLDERLKNLATPAATADEDAGDGAFAGAAVPDKSWRIERIPGQPSAFRASRIGPVGSPVSDGGALPVGGTYGAALPGGFEPLDHFSTEPSPEAADPSEPDKSLKQEIRELKWLARAVADRLEELDERLDAADRPEAPPPRYGSAEPPEINGAACGTMMLLQGPAGLKVVLHGNIEASKLPVGFALPLASEEMPPIGLKGVAGHKNDTLEVSTTVLPALWENAAAIGNKPIVVDFDQHGLEAAVLGNTVKYIVYLQKNAESTPEFETLSAVSAAQLSELRQNAEDHGTAILVLSVVKKSSLADNEVE